MSLGRFSEEDAMLKNSIVAALWCLLLGGCSAPVPGAPDMSGDWQDGGAANANPEAKWGEEPADSGPSRALVMEPAPPVATVASVSHAPALRDPPPRGPLLIGIWGQSNAVGMGTYPGTFPGDSRVTYYWNGTAFPLGPISNRHGIELAIGPALADATGADVIIGKGAVDATDAASWLPGSGANWPHETYTLNIMQRATNRPVHICTLQGESDALEGKTRATYLAELQEIAAGIRAGLAPHLVRFHVGLVNSHTPGAPAPIRQAQLDFVAGDEGSDAVDLDDLTPAIAPNHYDSHQLLDQIAPRFEASILR